jgi:hypothetical protein
MAATTKHKMTWEWDGRVRCSCGAVSPRMGTQARAREWMTQHRRTGKA